MGLNSSKPLKEQIRENKRELSRAIRELDRERAKLERQEAKVAADIRKAAKENQMVWSAVHCCSCCFHRVCVLILSPALCTP